MKRLRQLRKFTVLLKLPLHIIDEVQQSYGDEDVQGGKNIIIGYPPGPDTSPYHDPDIRYEKGKYAEQGIYIEDPFIGSFIGRFRCDGKEQDEVSQSQEAGQVYQVAGFQKYS